MRETEFRTSFKLAGATNKDGKEIHKNNQLGFRDSCRFTPFRLDKPACILKRSM